MNWVSTSPMDSSPAPSSVNRSEPMSRPLRTNISCTMASASCGSAASMSWSPSAVEMAFCFCITASTARIWSRYTAARS